MAESSLSDAGFFFRLVFTEGVIMNITKDETQPWIESFYGSFERSFAHRIEKGVHHAS
jgi:hypothetical protein